MPWKCKPSTSQTIDGLRFACFLIRLYSLPFRFRSLYSPLTISLWLLFSRYVKQDMREHRILYYCPFFAIWDLPPVFRHTGNLALQLTRYTCIVNVAYSRLTWDSLRRCFPFDNAIIAYSCIRVKSNLMLKLCLWVFVGVFDSMGWGCIPTPWG